jgi:hypothetical protein
MRKLLLKLATWLYSLTYERTTLDKVNNKLIRPVEGLVIDGVQYYEFVSVSDMPEARMVHYNHLRQESQLGVDRTTLNKYFEEMKKANDKGEASRLGSLIYMLQDTINNCTNIETLYNLSALVYFDKTEDLTCFDYDYNARKIAGFKALPNQSFFLKRLLQKGLRTAGGESITDIDQYLRVSQIKLKAYQQILSEPSEIET